MSSYITQYLDNIVDLVSNKQVVIIDVPAGTDSSIIIPYAVSNSEDENGNNIKSYVVIKDDDIAKSLASEQQKYSNVGFGVYITNINDNPDNAITYISSKYMIKLLLYYFEPNKDVVSIDLCDVIILSELYPNEMEYQTIVSLWLKAYNSGMSVPRIIILNSKITNDTLLPRDIVDKLEIKSPKAKNSPKVEYHNPTKNDLYDEIAKVVSNKIKYVSINNNMVIIVPNKTKMVAALEKHKFGKNVIFIVDDIIFRYDQTYVNNIVVLITDPDHIAYNYLPNTVSVIDSMLQTRLKELPSGGKRQITSLISLNTSNQHDKLCSHNVNCFLIRMCAQYTYEKLFKDDRNKVILNPNIIIDMLKYNIPPENVLRGIDKDELNKNTSLINKLGLTSIPKLARFVELLNLSTRNSTFLWYWLRGRRFGKEIINEGKKYNINYEEVEIDETSEYSSLKPYYIDSTSEIFELERVNSLESIIDATANIGSDSINFMRLFPTANLVSLEIDTEISYILRRNMKNLPRILGVNDIIFTTKVINMSATSYFDTFRYADMVYFDPPWGPNYLTHEKLMLYLDDIRIGSIINNLFEKGMTNLVILKLPKNADIDGIKDDVGYDVTYTLHDVINSVKNIPDYQLMFIRSTNIKTVKSKVLNNVEEEVPLLATTNPIFEGIVIASIIDTSSSYFRFPEKSRSNTTAEYNKILSDHKKKYFDKYLGYSDLDTYLNMWSDYMDYIDDIEYWMDTNSINSDKMIELVATINEVSSILSSYFEISLTRFNTNEAVTVARPILRSVYSDQIYIDPYKTGNYFNTLNTKNKYTLDNIENVNMMTESRPLGVIALITKTFSGIKGLINIITFGLDTDKTGLGELIIDKTNVKNVRGVNNKLMKTVRNIKSITPNTVLDIKPKNTFELINKNPFDILDELKKSNRIMSEIFPIILNEITITNDPTLVGIAQKITGNKSTNLINMLEIFQNVNANTLWATKVTKNPARFDDIFKIINQNINVNNTSTYLDQKTDRSLVYLDIGSGDAVDFNFIADKLNIKNAISVDIKDSRIDRSSDFYLLNVDVPLPFEDNSVDIITILHALHHSSDALFRLKDIYRILRVGGLFVLKDHDVINTDVANIVSFEHLVYSIGEGTATIKDAKNYNDIEPMYYYSADYIRNYLIGLGFKVLMFEIYNNPTRTWKGIFTKV
jgi:SAM-dependent methyltransferase